MQHVVVLLKLNHCMYKYLHQVALLDITPAFLFLSLSFIQSLEFMSTFLDALFSHLWHLIMWHPFSSLLSSQTVSEQTEHRIILYLYCNNLQIKVSPEQRFAKIIPGHKGILKSLRKLIKGHAGGTSSSCRSLKATQSSHLFQFPKLQQYYTLIFQAKRRVKMPAKLLSRST